MKSKIKILKAMIAANDSAAMDYLVQLTNESQTHEDKKLLTELAAQLLSESKQTMIKIESDIEEYNVKQQLGELADVINFSYIARTYFNKSKHWLYQRINGYNVNGQKATFTPSERTKFNDALNDVRFKISSFTSN
ncbi:MAG: DUF5053 domain-containing protein [Bacteroidota bacterium]